MKALAVALLALALPATASADNTPLGPATLMSEFTETSWIPEGPVIGVLVGAKVTVAPGGQAGMVRVLFRQLVRRSSKIIWYSLSIQLTARPV